jgi:hypothetical protein
VRNFLILSLAFVVSACSCDTRARKNKRWETLPPEISDPTPTDPGVGQPPDVCPSGACEVGARRCSADNRAVELCQADAEGCGSWASSPLPEDGCGAQQECQASVGGPVACECVSTPGCTVAGDFVCDGGARECVPDAQGCLILADAVGCAGASQCADGLGCACPAAPCIAGDRRCAASDDAVEICETDAGGCAAWVTSPLPADSCGSAQTCSQNGNDAICECPADTCSQGARRCNASGNGIESCVADPGGCAVWVTSALPEDSCGSNELCQQANDSASCACAPSACQDEGTICADSGNEGTCLRDADGCLYLAQQTACEDGKTCQVNRCGCESDQDCAPGYQCSASQGTCLEDGTAPFVLEAFLISPQVVRVVFSEVVGDAEALASSSYCIEDSDGDASSCLATGDFAAASVGSVDGSTFDVSLSSPALAKSYTIHVSSVRDLAGNLIGLPNYADFSGENGFWVVSASAVSQTRILVTFNRPVRAGDGAGGAECSGDAQCSARYKVIGPTSLGQLLSVSRQAAPSENQVLITHQLVQGGGTYTIIGANATNGDGFDDAAWGALHSASSEALRASPWDRAAFVGRGEPVDDFDDGPVMTDPFGDGSPFSYVFSYREKIVLGPNKSGHGAARANADGSQPENLTFSFARDTNGSGGSTTQNTTPAYTTIGSAACNPDSNPAACGPDHENGRGLFTAGIIDGSEWLIIGGAKNISGTGKLNYVYATQDADSVLDMKYLDLTKNTGPGTRAFSRMHVFAGRAYLGLPDSSGKRPYLVNLLHAPAAASSGLDANVNADGSNTACDDLVHDSCYLYATEMDHLGWNGGVKNFASVQMIDFFGNSNDKLYLGNNGGLARSTGPHPRDVHNWPGDWVAITPISSSYAGTPARFSSITTNKTADLEPRDRAWAQMAVWNGRVYLGRNTNLGPQLWRCDPELSGNPGDCDSGDWSLAAANGSGDLELSQFDNPNNSRITLVVASGGHLYVGYDNDVDGVVVYRAGGSGTVASSRADFNGQADCNAAFPGCAGLGGNGFGIAAENRHFWDAISLGFGGEEYLYVTVGDGINPVRVYRTR